MQKSFSKITVFFILFFLCFNAVSQNDLFFDIKLIGEEKVQNQNHKKKNRPYLYAGQKSTIKKYNPVNAVFGGLLFVYQNTLSQQFSASCLYNPSCSEFSKKSIQEYGLLKGIFLSADRVMRCNRIAATGIHPLRIENNAVIDPVEFYRLKE